MSSIYFLLPLGLLVSAAAVAVFIWAARSGQFDDLDTPPNRILFDDDRFGSDTGSEPMQSTIQDSDLT